MSELKRRHINEVMDMFCLTKGDLNWAYVYYADDADKVIAEKDKEIQRLENLCESYRIDCDNLAIREANAYKEIGRDNKQIRHQKYKRCLAMADMCAERRMYWTYRLQDDGDKGYSKDYKFGKNCFWRKWCVRWLALADKFKEA